MILTSTHAYLLKSVVFSLLREINSLLFSSKMQILFSSSLPLFSYIVLLSLKEKKAYQMRLKRTLSNLLTETEKFFVSK